MNKKNPAATALLLLVAIVILAGMSYLLYDKLLQITDNEARISTEKSMLAEEEQKLEQLEMLSDQDESVTAYIKACSAMMPEEPDESALIAYVQGVSNETGAELVQIKFEPQVAGERFVSIPLKLTMEGKYENLLNLLDRMRNGDRAVRVDGINATVSENGAGTIKAEISANSFYLGR